MGFSRPALLLLGIGNLLLIPGLDNAYLLQRLERSRMHFSTRPGYLKVAPKTSEDIDVGSCHKRQKPQAPTPQAPIRNRQTRKVANAKGLNRNTNLT